MRLHGMRRARRARYSGLPGVRAIENRIYFAGQVLAKHGLGEGVSTRLLIYAGRLITNGISARRACQVAVTWALTDDLEVQQTLEEVVTSIFE